MPTSGYTYAEILKFFVSIWIELMKKQGQQETFKRVQYKLQQFASNLGTKCRTHASDIKQYSSE
ncbi:hypothetical protein [Nostoc sp.]|uniref:hypothetical protein n=1 Tax=Nostoc sp. TaxID=1180 RepID=UPI002FF78B2D